MEIDSNRFGFIRAKGFFRNKLLQEIELIQNSLPSNKPYQLNWIHVLEQYDKLGIGDVAEFASSYSFGWHAFNNKLSDDSSKHAMYLEIIEGILKRRTNVK